MLSKYFYLSHVKPAFIIVFVTWHQSSSELYVFVDGARV